MILYYRTRKGGTDPLTLSGTLTSIVTGGKGAWLLVGLHGPVDGTSEVVIGAPVATLPVITARPIWRMPLVEGAKERGGSCDG